MGVFHVASRRDADQKNQVLSDVKTPQASAPDLPAHDRGRKTRLSRTRSRLWTDRCEFLNSGFVTIRTFTPQAEP